MTLLQRTLEFMNLGNWTRGSHARTRLGQACNIFDPEAVCFCLDGALHKLCGKALYAGSNDVSNYRDARYWLHIAMKKTFPGEFSYSKINDQYGFDAVVKLLKAAIDENSRYNLCVGLDAVHSEDNRVP